MPERSAGLLVWRLRDGGPEFLLGHPGGPFWARRDTGAWSIPKGLFDADEEPLAAARREFAEETGLSVEGDFVPLAPQRQKSGKVVLCWLVQADLDLGAWRRNSFEMEWPPRSGRRQTFPEIDRLGYFPAAEAATRILPGQRPFLEEAMARLGAPPAPLTPRRG